MKKTAAAVALLLTLSAVAAGQSQRPSSRYSAHSSSAAADSSKPKVRVDEAERVLDRSLLAQGGLALGLVKTRIMRGRVTLSDSPVPGTFDSYEKGLDRSMLVVNMPGGQLLAVQDGSKAWLQTPWGMKSAVTRGTEDAMGKAADGKGGFKWRNVFASLAVKGRAVVDGHETIALAITPHGKPPLTVYFDVETGLIRKQEFARPPAGEAEEHLKAVYFDSYATVDGVKIAVLVRQEYQKYTLTFRVTEVKHNVAIMDTLFEKPQETPKGK